MALPDLLDDGVWGCDLELRGGGDTREEKVTAKYTLNGAYKVITNTGFYLNKMIDLLQAVFQINLNI